MPPRRRADPDAKRKESEEAKRFREARLLAEHNARIESSRIAEETGSVRGVKRERKKVFDPEAGRYRMARAVPGNRTDGKAFIAPGSHPEAPHVCPACGASLPSYRFQGRYICTVDRLARKGYGCGYRWIGPKWTTEPALTDAEVRRWAGQDLSSDDESDEYDAIFT